MLITHGTLITMDPERPLIPDGALRIAGDRITDLGDSAALAERYPEDEVLDAGGMLVMPGFICAHTHFYGALSRGIPPRGIEPAADLRAKLENLWWRLDKALRPEDIRSSVEVCLVDAVRHGTTTLFDHHASPKFIDGTLDLIAETTSRAGVRACLCYEVSDRDGSEAAKAGIRENARFIRRCQSQPSPLLAGMMGLHASFTLSDQTLREAVETARELGVGCHIHVAEGKVDVAETLRRIGKRVVERLQAAGVLGPKTLAAHCVHIDDFEVDILRETRTMVVHNPRSNMNNAVGTARVPRLRRAGVLVGLGNDGFSNNMLVEMQAAFLVHKLAALDPRVMPAEEVLDIGIAGNRAIAGTAFPAPLGILQPNAFADIILVTYYPRTPITADNFAWHLIFGSDEMRVHTTIVGGRPLMRAGELLTLDEERIAAQARERAAKLWARY
ncbi:MAG: putative aminohydrolase SsnA [Anaerolineae bacterium]